MWVAGGRGARLRGEGDPLKHPILIPMVTVMIALCII